MSSQQFSFVEVSSPKKISFKSSKSSSITPPKPGSNSFHWFNYDQKIKMGNNYDYQEVLARWRGMSASQKKGFSEQASARPKHKRLPGRQRAASGYDILRRELSKHNYKEDERVEGVNLNTMASEIRAWMVINHPDTWDNWTTTPESRHLKLIDRAIDSIRW